MLCDIITDTVTNQCDMEVVGLLTDRRCLLSQATETLADVVVVGLEESELPDECRSLFDTQPWIRVLGIAADGRRAFLYELLPQRSPLGEVSPEQLVEVIRTSTRTPSVGRDEGR